jgi:hypothetical protein
MAGAMALGERVEGAARSVSDDREEWRRMIHGGRHQDRWGEDGRNDLASGERLSWRGTGRMAGSEWMVGKRESHADPRGVMNG